MMLSASGPLTLGYRGVPVARNVSFEVAPGGVLAVVGHNGAGKSTLIKTLLGMLPPIAGAIDWPAGRPATIAYLGQRTEFDTRFPVRLRDLAEMGAWRDLGFTGRIDAAGRARIADAMERTRTAAIFWLKNRCGWRSEPLVHENTDHKDKPASREEVVRQARKLCRLLEARGESVPDVTPTEMDEDKTSLDEFAEFDTGQSDT